MYILANIQWNCRMTYKLQWINKWIFFKNVLESSVHALREGAAVKMPVQFDLIHANSFIAILIQGGLNVPPPSLVDLNQDYECLACL